MHGRTAPQYYDSIDVLRGFAALSVFIYHVIELFSWSGFPSSGLLAWFRSGWMGVDLFFVISGFVIGLSAMTEIDRNGVRGYWRPFITRRLARIVPLHYLTMLVFAVFVVPEVLFGNFFFNLFSHVFFFHNFTVQTHGALNASNWSLAVEVQFYLLILCLAAWVREGRWWVILVTFVAIAWCWRYGVLALVDDSSELGVFPVFLAATQLPGMLDEFVAGLLLARLVRMDSLKALIFESVPFRVGIGLAAVLLTWVSMYLYWRYATFWNYPFMVVMWRSLLALAFMSALLFAVSLTLSGAIRVILSPLYYLGTISYGIYLWHLPVLLSLKRVGSIEPFSVLLIGFALTCLLASLSWHFFERPIMRKFGRQDVGQHVAGALGALTLPSLRRSGQ